MAGIADPKTSALHSHGKVMVMIRPSVAALNASGRYPLRAPSISLDHLVVGGGVVGLAITRHLAKLYPKASTILVERHASVGQETSSRNSEVIHAGIYYPRNSLKTRLCIKGRELLYEYCAKHGIPHRRVGKLIVAQEHQLAKLSAIHAHAQSLRAGAAAVGSAAATGSGGFNEHEVEYETCMAPPTRLLSGVEARELEPDLSPSIAGAVLSPSTGIIDSHALMQSLEKEIEESEGADVALSTRVVRVDRGKDGWVVQLVTGGTEGRTTTTTTDAVHVRTLINASGLSANLILNSVFPERRVGMYFARGMYAGYSGKAGVSRVGRLIYPVPDDDGHGFASLGTHLTLDMGNQIRFGPDLEWITAETGDEERRWERWLEPELSEERHEAIYEAITRYLPGVERRRLRADYVGIRPKLVGPSGGFQDFIIRMDREGAGRMLSLLGIESPGLTSSLALAEMVGTVANT